MNTREKGEDKGSGGRTASENRQDSVDFPESQQAVEHDDDDDDDDAAAAAADDDDDDDDDVHFYGACLH